MECKWIVSEHTWLSVKQKTKDRPNVLMTGICHVTAKVNMELKRWLGGRTGCSGCNSSSWTSSALFWLPQGLQTGGAQTIIQALTHTHRINV